MEFGMSRRIKPKQKYMHISMKDVWHNLVKNKGLWGYVVILKLLGRKVAQIGPSRC